MIEILQTAFRIYYLSRKNCTLKFVPRGKLERKLPLVQVMALHANTHEILIEI